MGSSKRKTVGTLPPACDTDTAPPLGTSGTMSNSARAYQMEMLQRSLKENVIVAMDTGSGKTQIAILRIRAQLESSSDKKIIWFLAPTVLLCAQQRDAIKLEIPSISIRLVTGADNVHTWKAPTWKSLLDGTQAIVSTYQVLLDALDHAFIKLSRLSLIIFDEAHNCVGSNPGGKIMTHFYHYQYRQERDPKQPSSLPAILGLTATPSMRADVTGLEQLEKLLSAKCISPSIHREELLKHVKRPELRAVKYDSPTFEQFTQSMASLRNEYIKMNLVEDPYVIFLRDQGTDKSQQDLEKVISTEKTWSRTQISGLLSRSRDILRQLGPWAADKYIWTAKHSFIQNLKPSSKAFDSWIPDEKRYVSKVLLHVAAIEPSLRPIGPDSISDKLHILLRELVSCDRDALGIIFVRERVTAFMLATLLQSIPAIRERYQVGYMVGTSNPHFTKRAVYESFDTKDLRTLHDFREGKINLLIATSVLEEGIDVPACNLVICFDSPPTPKSFIQRRGRARMQDSKLILLCDDSPALVDEWTRFDDEISKLCQDSEREREELLSLESQEEHQSLSHRHEETGARLDQDNAKQHLEHVCRAICPPQFVDSRPVYMVSRVEENSVTLVRAEVILPAALPRKLRRVSAVHLWRSERNAMRDAAFQACLALIKADLLNKHFLPLETDEDFDVETRQSMVFVPPLYDPWPEVADAWSRDDDRWVYRIQVHGTDEAFFEDYIMTIPVNVGPLLPAPLYLDYNTTYRIVFSPPERISASESNKMPDHTSTLVGLHFCHRWPMKEAPHVLKFTFEHESLAMSGIASRAFDTRIDAVVNSNYLIRDHSKSPTKYIGYIASKPAIEQVQRPFRDYPDAPNEVYLDLSKWTRRTDFLHAMKVDPETQINSRKTYECVLPTSFARVDSIHIKHARFGMLIPSIIHTVETMLIARRLSQTVLKPLGISDYLMLKEALSARSASEATHYERLEFLGDSILKYCASMQAAATNIYWSEAYLTRFKDRLVANARLSRACQETGLSEYILTNPFTGQKWRPFYLDTVMEDKLKASPNRNVATKVLADVVEALIGVTYSLGGIPKVIEFLSIFISNCAWIDPKECREEFFAAVPRHYPPSSHLDVLEDFVGYSFKKKALTLEATTHASYIGDITAQSWERLEFIGDAVLDYMIVNRLINHSPPVPHSRMHMIKTAMVNKDFLAFLSLEEHELSQPESRVTDDGDVIMEKRRVALWQFIRYSSNGIGPAQIETAKRHKALRQEIVDAIQHGDQYPWHLVARIDTSKFYSDMIEAMVGALWIDSGSFEVCETFLTRLGMLPYLTRTLNEGVHMQHPKEELGKLVQSHTMDYNIEVVQSEELGIRYNCDLKIKGRVVGRGRGGTGREMVRIQAATEAVALLKSNPAFLSDLEMTKS